MSKLTRIEWLRATERHSDRRIDGFARTFTAKCDMLRGWDRVFAARDADGDIAGAILITCGKRTPHVHNLQLLHVFGKYRRRGIARELALLEWARVFGEEQGQRAYLRVSSEEDAQEFYRSLGFKFWGEQKSGTLLSMFRIEGPTIGEGAYDREDATIRAALFSGRKGCITTDYGDPR